MTYHVTVFGLGSWGTALAQVLAENGHQVLMWGRDQKHVTELSSTYINQRYLPNILLSDHIQFTSDLKQAVMFSDIFIFVMPTQAIRQVARLINPLLTEQVHLVHASKGLELGTSLRISEILSEEIDAKYRYPISVLSGPSHAEEVVRHDITTITVASSDLEEAKFIQSLFSNHYFRVYTNSDVIGVELGAAFKNVIALGAGALAGLGYGDNAKAAIITRGLAEISRLGIAMGADPLTFIGLSGVGDLVVTATSQHSRNFKAGYALGQGKSLEDIQKNMGMVIEGVGTTQSAYDLAKIWDIEMPITEAIYRVIYDNAPIQTVAEELMKRSYKSE